MLRLRIFTALALLLVLVPAVFYPAPMGFAFVAGILMACAAWEWSRLNGASGLGAVSTGGLCAMCCIFIWNTPIESGALQMIWIASAIVWVFGGGYLLRSGVGSWNHIPAVVRQLVGFLLLCAAWLAVVSARSKGINFLFSAMSLVWVADIAAYFAGRRFGGQFFHAKLAASISPGKTKEGALGGLMGVLVLAHVWQWADRFFALDSNSIFTILASHHWVYLLLGSLFLGGMSVAGDLLESLVKRAAGAKDSSQLLPGHGGVLDRVDALLPVLPLAMLLQSF
jgi:phosphatidate cytidylyltransferase